MRKSINILFELLGLSLFSLSHCFHSLLQRVQLLSVSVFLGSHLGQGSFDLLVHSLRKHSVLFCGQGSTLIEPCILGRNLLISAFLGFSDCSLSLFKRALIEISAVLLGYAHREIKLG